MNKKISFITNTEIVCSCTGKIIPVLLVLTAEGEAHIFKLVDKSVAIGVCFDDSQSIESEINTQQYTAWNDDASVNSYESGLTIDSAFNTSFHESSSQHQILDATTPPSIHIPSANSSTSLVSPSSPNVTEQQNTIPPSRSPSPPTVSLPTRMHDHHTHLKSLAR